MWLVIEQVGAFETELMEYLPPTGQSGKLPVLLM
jgi:hypothetical protein